MISPGNTPKYLALARSPGSEKILHSANELPRHIPGPKKAPESPAKPFHDKRVFRNDWNWHNLCFGFKPKHTMPANHTLSQTNHTSGNLPASDSQALNYRATRSAITNQYSTKRFSTTQCSRCRHTFLRYAAACPECGLVRRRRKSHRARAKAILCSAIAIALTTLFIAETKSNANDGSNRPLPAYPSLAAASPARPAVNQKESGKGRYLVVREADLARMQFGLRVGSK